MSNARSPREVCSTTIGTSGLIVLALVSLRRSDSSRRLAGRCRIGGCPQAARLLGGVRPGALLLRRPQLFASLRLRDRDRRGPGRDQLDGLARGEILANLLEAPALAQVRQQRLWLHPLPLRGRRDHLEQLLIRGANALRRP